MKHQEPAAALAPVSLVGAHTSIAGGLCTAPARATAIGASTMQIFTKSNRSWFGDPISPEEATAFKAATKEANLRSSMVHAAYLINIAAATPATENTSVKSLALELERAQLLGIPFLVLHPGSHTGQGTAAGIAKIARNLDAVLASASGETMILLETMAGQGSNLGSSFQELRDIMDKAKHRHLLGVCLDTCHVFAAGYPFATTADYAETMALFDAQVGNKHLKAFHINGSKLPAGSHKDRHEELGKGKLPLAAIGALMQDQRFADAPKVLETPTPQLYAEEITLLRHLALAKS